MPCGHEAHRGIAGQQRQAQYLAMTFTGGATALSRVHRITRLGR